MFGFNALVNGSGVNFVDKFNDPLFIIDIVFAFILVIFCIICVFFFFKKKEARAMFLIGLTLIFVAIIFDLLYTALILCALMIILGVTALFFNMGYIRELLQNPASSKQAKNTAKAASKDTMPYDKEKLIKDVTTAVLKLSKTKTGAIMTFEKKMPLDNYMKNGTIIDCPFTPEIVETIFYVGTRLHDGAIIVRKNIIIAASVYYTPSTKALTGKFGARHRAALGISEATDSVTVICSEETGRISIAYNGQLVSVNRDEFAVIFKEYLDS